MPSKTHLIYFSPTKTTKKIVEGIAAGLGSGEIEHYDLTRMEHGLDLRLSDGVAVIGVPVYAGRVPEVCLERMKNLSAAGVPALLVALYGNREFEDALVELRDLAICKGFSVIAAGAFIGEHSYSTGAQPIAVNRPDESDLRKAREFGAAIAKRMEKNSRLETPAMPGNVPYRERLPLGGIAPETDRDRCNLCGACVEVCPTFVIAATDEVTTEAENCILCCACVKDCPEGARALNHPVVEGRREMLIKNCSKRREPELFF
ncbi:MAG: FeS-binding protein [Desulfuromonadaceae bacterium GWC2_58_13]|nr:MAG: FeS-binding protein [Desulfuromonadaceae bacterium GWC2_58_13]